MIRKRINDDYKFAFYIYILLDFILNYILLIKKIFKFK
jgi:hypothetical protein